MIGSFMQIPTPKVAFLSRTRVPLYQIELSFPQKVFFCQAKYSESEIDESFSLRLVPPNLVAAEKEEAKAVLTLFFKKQGLSKALASKAINKSEPFINHLISRLHFVHKSRYLVGRELTTLEIREALIPYLEALHEEYGSILLNVVESFPNQPILEKVEETVEKLPPSVTPASPPSDVNAVESFPNQPILEKVEETVEKLPPPVTPASPPSDVNVVESFPNQPILEKVEETVEKLPPLVTPASPPSDVLDSRKVKALERVSDSGPTGKLPAHILYLVELGMDIEKIRVITRRFPPFAFYCLEGKIRPLVEFLLNLGVPKSQIPIILGRSPQLCGFSLTNNLIRTMAFLEELGVDKEQWAKVIHRFPALLTFSRPKLRATVDFLYEMGLSAESVGKVLTRYPKIMGFSVKGNLRPTTDYFRSIGVDVSLLLYRCPQTFGHNVEASIKPVNEFFKNKGFSMAEIAVMVTRCAALYTYSLAKLVLKWEFYLTMGYPKEELIKFPQYFSYSLEGRIKPRFATMTQKGVRLLLNTMLFLSQDAFNVVLEKKLKKLLDN